MERHFQFQFQSSFLNEEASSDSSYNAVFSDGTLQSLIPISSNTSSFNFFSEDFPALTHNSHSPQQQQQQQLTPFNFKPPKNQPFINNIDNNHLSTQPFHFFSNPTTFNHLPHLHSLELTDSPSSSSSSPTRKRQTLDSSVLLQTCNFPKKPSRQMIPHSELARQRRQKISDKTRCLQKLMPWDKKMDTATMLEEAYKYVQFLQAQITALQSMPCDSSFTTVNGCQNDGRFVSGLGSLNRQQLLQVLVNSPVAQTMLYSQGFCVFSMEQLVLLKKVASRRAVLQHHFLMNDPSRRS